MYDTMEHIQLITISVTEINTKEDHSCLMPITSPIIMQNLFQAGFNAGNGTGWTSLPYSGEGRVLKLQEFSNVGVPGRWLYRVDEQIITGGCSNESIGKGFINKKHYSHCL